MFLVDINMLNVFHSLVRTFIFLVVRFVDLIILVCTFDYIRQLYIWFSIFWFGIRILKINTSIEDQDITIS